MPTYDYACKACGHAFEHFQPMGDKLLRTCPECGKRRLERLIGAGSGIVFRGSGFYETDYKRKSGKPDGSAADKTAKPAAGDTGAGKTDTPGSGSSGPAKPAKGPAGPDKPSKG